jgi:hypothetical protein
MTTTIRTHGIKELLVELRKLEPELHKALKTDLVNTAKPLAAKVGAGFPKTPLDNWKKTGRSGKARMPAYQAGAVAKGVKPVYASSLKRDAILRIEQKNAGGQVYDSAGSRSNPSFVRNLDKHLTTKSRLGKSRSRVLYSGVKKNINMVEKPIADVIRRLERRIQQTIVRGA